MRAEPVEADMKPLDKLKAHGSRGGRRVSPHKATKMPKSAT